MYEGKLKVILRLGSQSVTLLSTLRDPTQLRRRQWATRQQRPFFVAHQKEDIDGMKKVQLAAKKSFLVGKKSSARV